MTKRHCRHACLKLLLLPPPPPPPPLLLLLLLLHPFTGFFSRTTRVSCHQKGTRDDGWQWHQLDHKQIICTSLQTDNHTSTSSLSFYRPDALRAAHPTVSKHWRHGTKISAGTLVLCNTLLVKTVLTVAQLYEKSYINMYIILNITQGHQKMALFNRPHITSY